MTSSNGNIFRVTGLLCGEFTDDRWIPRTKASDAEHWCFSLICAWINGWVINGGVGDLSRHRAHYDVTVMMCNLQFHQWQQICHHDKWPRLEMSNHSADSNTLTTSADQCMVTDAEFLFRFRCCLRLLWHCILSYFLFMNSILPAYDQPYRYNS